MKWIKRSALLVAASGPRSSPATTESAILRHRLQAIVVATQALQVIPAVVVEFRGLAVDMVDDDRRAWWIYVLLDAVSAEWLLRQNDLAQPQPARIVRAVEASGLAIIGHWSYRKWRGRRRECRCISRQSSCYSYFVYVPIKAKSSAVWRASIEHYRANCYWL